MKSHIKKEVVYTMPYSTKKDIQKTIKAANNAFKFISENINNIDVVLEGKRSISIFRKNT